MIDYNVFNKTYTCSYIYFFLYRNHAVGLASFWENVGGIVAPFIVYGVRKKYNMYY